MHLQNAITIALMSRKLLDRIAAAVDGSEVWMQK
jgi:hypothetical protein